MTEMPEPDGRLDAVRGAQQALGGTTPPDARVLQAVEAGLLSTLGGNSIWVDVPHQRPRRSA
jgi:hypothetical protein